MTEKNGFDRISVDRNMCQLARWKRNSLAASAAVAALERRRRLLEGQSDSSGLLVSRRPQTALDGRAVSILDTSVHWTGASGRGRKLDRPLVKRPFCRGNSATTGTALAASQFSILHKEKTYKTHQLSLLYIYCKYIYIKDDWYICIQRRG